MAKKHAVKHKTPELRRYQNGYICIEFSVPLSNVNAVLSKA